MFQTGELVVSIPSTAGLNPLYGHVVRRQGSDCRGLVYVQWIGMNCGPHLLQEEYLRHPDERDILALLALTVYEGPVARYTD